HQRDVNANKRPQDTCKIAGPLKKNSINNDDSNTDNGDNTNDDQKVPIKMTPKE
ncbi:10908_t:CDS:2, partial [Gigaspora margarita]